MIEEIKKKIDEITKNKDLIMHDAKHKTKQKFIFNEDVYEILDEYKEIDKCSCQYAQTLTTQEIIIDEHTEKVLRHNSELKKYKKMWEELTACYSYEGASTYQVMRELEQKHRIEVKND